VAPKTFHIEPVRSADLESLTAHMAEVADEPLFVLTLDFPRTRDQVERFMGQVLASPYVGLLVAKQEKQIVAPQARAGTRDDAGRDTSSRPSIVGHILIRSTDHPALRHVAKISMAVSEVARRQGVGEALLTAAEGWAKDHAVQKIVLDVLANNRPALRLYEKLRYREEGARKDQVVIDGQYHDELLLAKFLG
jgi:ribosomal protein S18 acetylase RimI-like enzyme